MNEILSVGAGRGGHGILQRLAETGERRFAILDDDRVEAANLPNLRLGTRWIGWPKAKELAYNLAGDYGATVRWADTKFSPRLLAERSPYADMIFMQRVFLALTDDLSSQLALAATAARLEIPLVAIRAFAGGGGDVFAQLDVNRSPCFACFTAYLRRTDVQQEPIRGRDLPVGAADGVDALATEVVGALLGPSRRERRRLFSPYRRFGSPYAWEIDPTSATTPIFIQRDPGCAICGDAVRPRVAA